MPFQIPFLKTFNWASSYEAQGFIVQLKAKISPARSCFGKHTSALSSGLLRLICWRRATYGSAPRVAAWLARSLLLPWPLILHALLTRNSAKNLSALNFYAQVLWLNLMRTPCKISFSVSQKEHIAYTLWLYLTALCWEVLRNIMHTHSALKVKYIKLRIYYYCCVWNGLVLLTVKHRTNYLKISCMWHYCRFNYFSELWNKLAHILLLWLQQALLNTSKRKKLFCIQKSVFCFLLSSLYLSRLQRTDTVGCYKQISHYFPCFLIILYKVSQDRCNSIHQIS